MKILVIVLVITLLIGGVGYYLFSLTQQNTTPVYEVETVKTEAAKIPELNELDELQINSTQEDITPSDISGL